VFGTILEIMAKNIHLYMCPGSCALAVHIILRHSGLPFTTTPISVRYGFPKDLLHLNPKGRVPILIIGNETITEVPAIMTAVSQLVPEKKLLGKTAMEVVRSYEWMNWISGTLHAQAYAALFQPRRFSSDETAHEGIQGKAKEAIKSCYETIEEKLAGKEWSVGDDFTAVDAYLFVFYRWGNGNGFAMNIEYPNYSRMVEKLADMKAVTETVKHEGIDLLNDH
jgi:glutathione S-transferase